MSFSIALTAATRYDMLLTGSASAGVGATVWLMAHYVTKGSLALLDKMGEPKGRVPTILVKALQVIIAVGELVKFASLYSAGIGVSVTLATAASSLSLPALPILIVGTSCAAVYALSQTFNNKKVIPVPI